MAALPQFMSRPALTGQYDGPGTHRFPFGGSAAFDGSLLGTEITMQTIWRTPGTASQFYVHVEVNGQISGTTVFRVRKNTANGNQSLSVPFGVTGHFQDTVNIDTIASGDKMGVQVVCGASSSTMNSCISGFLFAPTDPTISVTRWLNNGGAVEPAGANPRYIHVAGFDNDSDATEITNESNCPTAGTLLNAACYVSSNTRNGSVVYSMRKNSTNATVTLTIPTGTTGWFEDLTNTDTVAPGDKVAWLQTANGTSGTIRLDSIMVDYRTTNGTGVQCGGQAGTVPTGTSYGPLGGDLSVWNTTESRIQSRALLAGLRISYLSVRVSGTPGPFTITLRKNSADTALVVTVPTSLTGWFSDTTNIVTCASADDFINLKMTASVSTALSSIGVLFGLSAAPMPVPLPPSPLIQCVPRDASNGGKGNSGCNFGGVGLIPC